MFKTQGVIALSFAETESYTIGTRNAEALHVPSFLLRTKMSKPKDQSSGKHRTNMSGWRHE